MAPAARACNSPDHPILRSSDDTTCENKVDELLNDHEAPLLGIGQFLPHSIEGPAQSLAIGFALQIDDWR
jgi:hypothetical protein